MIAGNELRIGNKVLYNGKIKTVTKTDFSTQLKNGVFGAFYPIEITHEILMSCGCEFFQDAGIYKLNGYKLNMVGSAQIVFVFEPEFWAVEMKSLHQFMNTIYWLTNKEVIFK